MLTTETAQWRAGAAADADRAATRREEFVRYHANDAYNDIRRLWHDPELPANGRRVATLYRLAASVERQARISGCGSVLLPVQASEVRR